MDTLNPLHYGSAFATEALLSAFAHDIGVMARRRQIVCAGQRNFVERYLQQNALDEWMRPWPLAATYLLWLDCSGLALSLSDMKDDVPCTPFSSMRVLCSLQDLS